MPRELEMHVMSGMFKRGDREDWWDMAISNKCIDIVFILGLGIIWINSY